MTDWDHADQIADILGSEDDPVQLYCTEHDRWEPCRTCLYSKPVPAFEVDHVVGEVLRNHGIWRTTVREEITKALRERFTITLKSPYQRAVERRQAGE